MQLCTKIKNVDRNKSTLANCKISSNIILHLFGVYIYLLFIYVGINDVFLYYFTNYCDKYHHMPQWSTSVMQWREFPGSNPGLYFSQ